MSEENTLHRSYRPSDLDGVIGHKHVVDSLSRFEEDDSMPHTYLFSGPSGTGKTTFARIIANIVKGEVVEVDAATFSGVDNMRALTDGLRYRPIGKPSRVLIIDECHMLTKQAWNSLLKSTEEPPDYAYFVFCTTDPTKVPKTIKTRSHSYDLKPLKMPEVFNLLSYVSKEEDIDIHPDELEEIAEASEGSPRQALVYLSQCRSIDPDDLKIILSAPGEDPDVIELCRALAKGTDWANAVKLVKKLEGKYTAESIRIIVLAYFTKVAMNSKKPPMGSLAVLDAFSGDTWRDSDRYAPLILALGDLLI